MDPRGDYEHYFHDADWELAMRAEILRFVPRSGAKILDVGCGTGRKSARLVRSGNNVTGCDVSSAMLQRAASRIGKTVLCDVTQGLPFPNESFDLVFSSAVLEHLFDYGHVLREMFRVLRPGGRVIVEVPNSAYWPNRLLMLAGRNLIWIGVGKHIRAFNKWNLAKAMSDAGFSGIGVHGTILPMPKTSLRVYLPYGGRLLPGLCLTIFGVAMRPVLPLAQ